MFSLSVLAIQERTLNSCDKSMIIDYLSTIIMVLTHIFELSLSLLTTYLHEYIHTYLHEYVGK